MISDIMEIKQLIKEKGTKEDWNHFLLTYCIFFGALAAVLYAILQVWSNDIVTAVCLYFGVGAYLTLFCSMELNKIRRRIYKRHGIPDYKDEEIAELEERIRRLEMENDKRRW